MRISTNKIQYPFCDIFATNPFTSTFRGTGSSCLCRKDHYCLPWYLQADHQFHHSFLPCVHRSCVHRPCDHLVGESFLPSSCAHPCLHSQGWQLSTMSSRTYQRPSSFEGKVSGLSNQLWIIRVILSWCFDVQFKKSVFSCYLVLVAYVLSASWRPTTR